MVHRVDRLAIGEVVLADVLQRYDRHNL
jgi:hypothetical protein